MERGWRRVRAARHACLTAAPDARRHPGPVPADLSAAAETCAPRRRRRRGRGSRHHRERSNRRDRPGHAERARAPGASPTAARPRSLARWATNLALNWLRTDVGGGQLMPASQAAWPGRALDLHLAAQCERRRAAACDPVRLPHAGAGAGIQLAFVYVGGTPRSNRHRRPDVVLPPHRHAQSAGHAHRGLLHADAVCFRRGPAAPT